MDLTQKLTLAMSAGALVISALVAWQTYRGRRLNEATNRAIVTVESARMTTFKRGGGEILLTLENSGKAVALDVSVKYFAGVVLQLTEDYPNPVPPLIGDNPIEFGNIAPGKRSTRTIVYGLPEDRDLARWANLVVISLKLKYSDEATDTVHNEQLSYSGILSGKTIITPEMLPGPLPSLEALDKVFPKTKNGEK
jgi:hypothetical protein